MHANGLESGSLAAALQNYVSRLMHMQAGAGLIEQNTNMTSVLVTAPRSFADTRIHFALVGFCMQGSAHT